MTHPANFSLRQFGKHLGLNPGDEPTEEQKQQIHTVAEAYASARLANTYLDAGRYNVEKGEGGRVTVPLDVPKEKHGEWLANYAAQNPSDPDLELKIKYGKKWKKNRP